jgi:predicted DNA-binding protein
MTETLNGKVVHISDEMHERLKKFCEKYDASMRECVEEALELYIKAAASVEKNAR